MTRPFEKHLDDDEIGALLFLASGSSGGAEISDALLRELRSHVESCEFCGRKVQMHEDAQRGMHRLESPKLEPPGPDCPADESEWQHLVVGLLPEERSKQLMSHASQCDHCGPLLRVASELVTEDVTPSEENLLAEWSSRSQSDARVLAEKLLKRNQAATIERPSRHWATLLLWPRPLILAGTLGALMLAGWLGMRTLFAPNVDHLLAQAYEENRTLEVRIPGAKFAPLRVERGQTGSSFDQSPSLLKAEILIGEHLAKSPNDPVWLEARARAYLLNGKAEQAIQTLQKALAIQPTSAPILTDLGSAYYLRAESRGQSSDYGFAIEDLSKALALSPDDPVSLYNRALACHRAYLYTQEIEDWEHYLRVDPQGDWAADARKRLNDTQKSLSQRQKSLVEPLLTPEEISRNGQSGLAALDLIDERVEEYLKIAAEDWLPKAFPAPPKEASEVDLAALKRLAKVASTRHADNWLSDLLNHAGGRDFGVAAVSLSEAILANERGYYSDARASAYLAAQQFRHAANPAGEIRAMAEEVYSDHLVYEGPACIELLHTLEVPLGSNRYPWLQANMSLERSVCADLIGDQGMYQAAIYRAMSVASTADDLRNVNHSIAWIDPARGMKPDGTAVYDDTPNKCRDLYDGGLPVSLAYRAEKSKPMKTMEDKSTSLYQLVNAIAKIDPRSPDFPKGGRLEIVQNAIVEVNSQMDSLYPRMSQLALAAALAQSSADLIVDMNKIASRARTRNLPGTLSNLLAFDQAYVNAYDAQTKDGKDCLAPILTVGP